METIPANNLNKEGIMNIYEDFIEEFNGPEREGYISYFDVVKVSELNVAEGSEDEFCILVWLRNKLPEGLELPSVYKGVKIYTK